MCLTFVQINALIVVNQDHRPLGRTNTFPGLSSECLKWAGSEPFLLGLPLFKANLLSLIFTKSIIFGIASFLKYKVFTDSLIWQLLYNL